MATQVVTKNGVQITVTGKQTRKVEAAVEKRMRSRASRIFTKAKVYVPKETGALEKSGQLKEKGSGFGYVADIYFGGATAPYSLWVHENLNARHAPPTCAKFLEKAVREEVKGKLGPRETKAIPTKSVGKGKARPLRPSGPSII